MLSCLLLFLTQAFGADVPFMRYKSPGYGCDQNNKYRICYTNGSTPACPSNFATPSALFGCQGELWKPNGRLQDYAFAGYGAGMRSIPYNSVRCNVRDYGAKGDNKTDDTVAVQRAVDDCARGNNGSVVSFPPGSYVITSRIRTSTSVVLRGANKATTELYFPRSLSEVDGNEDDNLLLGYTKYSYGDGFLTFGSWYDPRRIVASITSSAQRGTYRIRVNSTARLSVNMWILITQSEIPSGSLSIDLHKGDNYTGDSSKQTINHVLRHGTRIVAINDKTLTLERPLPWNISVSWSPQVWWFNASTSDGAGVEDLTLRFRNVPFVGHFKEKGYNGIYMRGTTNCWIRRVDVWNAESSIFMPLAMFCTLENININSHPRIGPDGTNGHFGIGLARSIDVLLKDFTINADYQHSVSVSDYTSGTVIKNGKGAPGININFDHHRSSPFGVLWTNIDVGNGSRWWKSNGNGGYGGSNVAALVTFWNIKTSKVTNLPRNPTGFGGNLNIVGLWTNGTVSPLQRDWWGENPPRLYPADLHSAMVSTKGKRIVIPSLPNSPKEEIVSIS
jgi:hypothetical protein